MQRTFQADGHGGWNLTFTAGTEIADDLAAQAYSRTTGGPLTDQDVGELRQLALKTDRSIDDNERTFIAALLDPTNATTLHATNRAGFGHGASVTFPGAAITAENRDQVKDFGRQPGAGPTPMTIGAKPPSITQQILDLAGTRFAPTMRLVIGMAKRCKIPLKKLHEAMIAAASDSTEGDRLLAGAAYVIAVRAKLAGAADILSGKIKVDEVSPSSITGTAMYVTTSTLDRKGDTIYLPTSFDVTSIAYQGLLVHELTHAAGDKAATSLTSVNAFQFELDGYRAQARYWLKELSALKGRKLTAAIAKIAPDANQLSILAMLLEDLAHPHTSPVDIVAEIQRLSPGALTAADWSRAGGATSAQLELMALTAIQNHPVYRGRTGASVGGLKGESFLDE